MNISVVFTWQLPRARKYADSVPHSRVRVGGPAVGLMPEFFSGSRAEVGGSIPGVLQRWNPLATRTSLGCPRKCKFCGVPRVAAQEAIEASGYPIMRFEDWADLPVIADDNLLAAGKTQAERIAHFDKVCDRLEKHDWCDFNQGTDARLVTEHHAERLARLNRPTIRMALDSMSYVEAWDRALEKLLRAGVAKRNLRTYCIMAFGTSPDQCWKICEHVEKAGVKPLPMWFHELDALERNIVTPRQAELGWNDYERCRLMQWFYQHKRAVLNFRGRQLATNRVFLRDENTGQQACPGK
jgi:hypothetical protein